jgi:hypothetical protein
LLFAQASLDDDPVIYASHVPGVKACVTMPSFY